MKRLYWYPEAEGAHGGVIVGSFAIGLSVFYMWAQGIVPDKTNMGLYIAIFFGLLSAAYLFARVWILIAETAIDVGKIDEKKQTARGGVLEPGMDEMECRILVNGQWHEVEGYEFITLSVGDEVRVKYLRGRDIVRELSLTKAFREKNICPKCNYNLTANTSGACPECGTPIDDAAGDEA